MKPTDVVEHRRLWAVVTGGTLWAGWLISVSAGLGSFDLAGQIVGTDWIQFHAAGATILRGQGAHLYDLEWQHRLQESLLGARFERVHAFLNPPLYAALLAPFSAFPYRWSFAVWTAVSLVLLGVSLRLLNEETGIREFGLTLTFFPVFAAITFGQNGLLSLVILSGVWVFWARHRSFAAGLFASLLLYKPQILVGLVLLWLIRFRRDGMALLGLGAGGTLLAGLSFGLLPAASQHYQQLVLQDLPSLMTMEGFPIWHAHHLRAFWHLLVQDSLLASALWILSALLCLGALGMIAWRNAEDRRVLFSAAMILTLLVAPHGMIYDWAILLIPFSLITSRVFRCFPARRAEIVSLVWTVLLISGSLTYLQLGLTGRAIQLSVPMLVYAAWPITSLGLPKQAEV